MQIFNCQVWLNGNGIRTTQVPKNGISAAEVIVLRKLHGLDSVVDIDLIGDEKRQLSAERAKLERTYGKKLIVQLFGDPMMDDDRFPVKLSNFKPKGAKAKAEVLEDMVA